MELSKGKTDILGKGSTRIFDYRLCMRVLFPNKGRYIIV
jgi:hypothetical protein